MARRVSLALLWGIVIGCSQSPPEDASADSLLSQMRSGDAHARGSAAKVLSTLRDERTVEPLIAIFQDTGCAPEVRVTAAQVLAQIGDGRAVQPLIVALMDEDPYIRRSAAGALERMQSVPNSGEGYAWYLFAERRFADCARLGEAAVEPLIAALGDDDDAVRCSAAEALGEIGDKRAVEPLISVLQSEELSCSVADTVERGRNGRLAKKPLARKAEKIRCSAVDALGQLQDARAVEPLINVLQDSDCPNAIRCSAALALAQIGDQRAVEPLFEAMDGDFLNSLGVSAALALSGMGDKRPVERYIAALRKREHDQGRVAVVLGELGDPQALSALAAMLDRDDWLAGRSAIQAIGQIGGDRAVRILAARLIDEKLGKTAAETLEAMEWRPQTKQDRVNNLLVVGDPAVTNEANWPDVREVLLQHASSGDRRRMTFALKKSWVVRDRIAPDMIRLLQEDGTKTMASAYYEHGSGEVGKAGSAWLRAHGYEIWHIPANK